MPPLKARLPKDELMKRLKNASPEQHRPPDTDHPLDKLKQNDLLQLAKARGLVTEEEFNSSLSFKERTVKTYLWTVVHDPAHRAKLRDYAIMCSSLYVHASALLNLCFCTANHANRMPTFVEDVWEALKSGNKSKECDLLLQVVLPARVNEPLPIVKAALQSNPHLQTLIPDWRGLSGGSLSMWDNAVKYIANKYAGAIKNHVLVHLVARLKHKLRTECLEPDLAVKAFMEGGLDEELCLQDRWLVDEMRCRLGTKAGDEVVPPDVLKPDLLAWHFELAKERQSFSPFPMAGLTRSYHLLDDRICEGLFGKGVGLQNVFGTTPSEWCKRTRAARCAKRQRKRRQGKGNTARMFMLKSSHVVTSVETDGYGLGVHFKAPHVHRYDDELDGMDGAARATEVRKRQLVAMQKLKDPLVAANDPGGYFLYFIAVPNVQGGHDKIRYSRDAWRRDIRLQERAAWNEERGQQPEVKSAMAALSTSGGYHHADLDKWRSYTQALSCHWDTLRSEFLELDDRCKTRMSAFRLRKRALDRAADRVLRFCKERMEDANQGLVICYGNGNVALGAKGTPVKSIYQALLSAFKRRRMKGGVRKVGEQYTTKRCYQCGEDMKAVYAVIDGVWKENRDLRCCTTCGGEQGKLRHRDFNAAINIRLVGLAELEGKRRPKHLCKRDGVVGRKRGADPGRPVAGRKRTRKIEVAAIGPSP